MPRCILNGGVRRHRLKRVLVPGRPLSLGGQGIACWRSFARAARSGGRRPGGL